MEPTTEDWMIEQHLCRCCHSEGKFKSLISTDPRMEDELLYLDALRFCLDIELCLVEGPLAYAACTICELCVARLQEACSFRRQVLSCEGHFQALYSQNRIKVAVAKSEPVTKEELSDSDESYFEDNRDVSMYFKEEEPKERKMPVPPRVLRKRDRPRTEVIPRAPQKKRYQVLDSDYKRTGDKFTCTRCSKTLGSLDSLKGHITVLHLSESKNKCKLCDESFHFNRSLLKHKHEKHNIDDRFKCDACDNMFYTISEMTRHKSRFHNPGVKRKCQKCDYECFNVAQLRRHKMKHTEVKKKIIKHTEVKKKKTNRWTLQIVESDYKRTIDDQYTCTRCEVTLKNFCKLKKHIRTLHNDEGYYCIHCKTNFRTASLFVNHQLNEHDIDHRLKCNACPKKFTTKTALRKHINNFHMLGVKRKCPLCDFECYGNLSRHMIKHTTVKNFHCKYCKKSFLRKNTLRFHERIHTGDRRKVCAECGQAFVQKASLNYHMMKYHPEVKF